jgi:hypothetical protein
MMLQQSDTVVVIANGLITTSGYNPFMTFRLDTLMGARETAHDPLSVEIMMAHGATDVPVIDIRSGIETLADNMSFGSLRHYLEAPFANHKFRLTNNTGSETIETYDLPLIGITTPGTAGIIITSGFMNPASNNNGPAFSTMFVRATGGPFVALQPTDPEAYARIQLIHNSADKSVDTVDLYLDGNKIVDNFPFRTATGFLDADVTSFMNLGIAPKTSTSTTDIFHTQPLKFDSAKRYVIVFDGIKSTSGYSPLLPLAVRAFTAAQEEAANTSNTDILMAHGATDLPTVDLREGTNVLVDNLTYGNFAPYFSLPANKNYVLTVTNDNATVEIEKYKGELMTGGLQGQSITLLMSGFQNPAANSNGAPWGLYYATATGGPLVPLAISTSVKDLTSKNGITIWPNPATDKLHISSKQTITIASIYDITGKTVKVVYKPEGEIAVGQLSKGTYLIKLETDMGVVTHRFVKQ